MTPTSQDASPGRKLSIWFVSVLLAGAFLLMLHALFGRSRPVAFLTSLFAAEEDGSWMAVTLGGQPAPPQEYFIGIRDRKVRGGRDGCNSWAYTDEGPDERGERSVTTTLVDCPEDPLSKAYHVIVFDPRMEILPDGTLLLSRNGYRGIFRRCHWRRRPTASNSEARECVLGR